MTLMIMLWHVKINVLSYTLLFVCCRQVVVHGKLKSSCPSQTTMMIDIFLRGESRVLVEGDWKTLDNCSFPANHSQNMPLAHWSSSSSCSTLTSHSMISWVIWDLGGSKNWWWWRRWQSRAELIVGSHHLPARRFVGRHPRGSHRALLQIIYKH